MEALETKTRLRRSFLPDEFKVSTWEELQPWYLNLTEREIDSGEDLKAWFRDRSELESVIGEDFAWRYINMSRDTASEEKRNLYQDFVVNIQPKIAPLDNELNRKVLESPYLSELTESGYPIMIRQIRKEFEIFREENIPLFTEVQTLSQKYGEINGAMTVEIDGQELTLQQAGVFLLDPDRGVRENAYMKINERRMADRDVLDDLYTQLVNLRNQIAMNAGFENFRDFMFTAMGRFDYTPQDCFDFHDSVQQSVVPLVNRITEKRKETMGLDELRPWDKRVDPESRPALKPFHGAADLTRKVIRNFEHLDPFLGECIRTMERIGHLDLDSRKGKAPGGYNYPLAETGVPFIFMNATSKLRDMVTLLHEGGHAVHSFVVSDLELNAFKGTPSEVAELASMSMELITMDHWDIYFSDPEELRRARQEHLEEVIETLPWVAVIDKFQHWVYENPDHTLEERKDAWLRILGPFEDGVTSWKGLEKFHGWVWQKQLHLYEVPFYYIEYGMAQLGAIAIWRRYKEDPQAGLEGYLNALKLGYTRSIPEIYEAAGIRFDFSESYIAELMQFVKQELEHL